MSISEEIVLGKENILNVRHITLKGSNFEIGRSLAEIAKSNHSFDLKHLKSTNEKHTQELKNYFEKNYPIYYQKMEGIAAAFKTDIEDYKYDFTGLPYNLELPEQIGCSSIYIPPVFSEQQEGLLSRNYDFPLTTLADLMNRQDSDEQRKTIKPMMAEPYVIELYPMDEGYPSLCISSFDLLGGVLDGINSEGLAVCLNGDEIAMSHYFKERLNFGSLGVGLNELQSMRLLLDTCATVEEAKRVLKENKHYFTFLPCHYLIADRFGKSVVFEYDYQEKVHHFIEETNKPQIMTNHPLSIFPSIKNFPEKSTFLEAGTSSFQRYEEIVGQLEKINPPYSQETIMSLCKSVSISEVIKTIPQNYQIQILSQPGLSLTLWHSIYNCHRRNLSVKFLINKEVTKDQKFIEHYSDYFSFEIKNEI